MADKGFTAEELVQACNKIIVYSGLLARVSNVEEVRMVCSSSPLLVAALEGFFGRRLDNVIRSASMPMERAYNFSIVVEVLSQILTCDLSHISGQRIVEGSIEDISNILELLAALCQGRPLQGPPPPEPDVAAADDVSATADDWYPSPDRSPHDEEVTHDGSSDGDSSDDSPAAVGDSSDEVRQDLQGHPCSPYKDHGQHGKDRQVPGSEEDASLHLDAQASYHRQQDPPPQQQQQSDEDGAAATQRASWQHQRREQQEQQAARGGGGYGQGRVQEAPRRDAVGASSPGGGGIRVRRRGSGSGRHRRTTSLHRAVATVQHHQHHVPLSPIQEVSKEGWETSRASKGGDDDEGTASDGGGRHAGPAQQPSHRHHRPAGVDAGRCSTDGASSLISMPSAPQGNFPGDSSSSPSSLDPGHLAWLVGDSVALTTEAEARLAAEATVAAESPPWSTSSYSDGTSTLLGQALSQAEATLRSLGREYDDFYYDEEDENGGGAESATRRRRRPRKKQLQQQQEPHSGPDNRRQKQEVQRHAIRGGGATGSGFPRAGGPPGYEPARRARRAAPWPDSQSGSAPGRVQQHAAFLRRAGRALAEPGEAGSTTTVTTTTTTTSASVGVPPSSATGSGAGLEMGRSRYRSSALSPRASKPSSAMAPAARKPAEAGGGGPAAATSREGARSGGGSRRREGTVRRGGDGGGISDDGHGTLLRMLRESAMPMTVKTAAAEASGHGRKLVRRAPEKAAEEPLYGEKGLYGEAELVRNTGGCLPNMEATESRRLGLQLNPELKARLRHLFRLATEDPRQRAARAAVESLAVEDDLVRHARRRALIERLSSARARREATMRQTTERLREQAREYEKRMEQLRLQRLAAEWAASQRSARMRRAVAAELALRDMFLQVLEREKEGLLAERQAERADAAAAFPSYKRAMHKAEDEYLEVLALLGDLLAAERQQRLRADREAMTAHRHFNALAAGVVRDRVAELLGRVARDDAAALTRRGLATQPRARRALIEQIQRLLGLA